MKYNDNTRQSYVLMAWCLVKHSDSFTLPISSHESYILHIRT